MKRLPMIDPLAEIRRIYFETSRATIDRDFERALDLLKSMSSEAERSRATVFMQGLAQMRSEWKETKGDGGKRRPGERARRER